MEENREFAIEHQAAVQVRITCKNKLFIFILGNFYGLDIHTYPFVCFTLRFSSSCSSLSSPSGDRKLRETRLFPHTHTKCRWKVRSGIFWMMTSSTGHG